MKPFGVEKEKIQGVTGAAGSPGICPQCGGIRLEWNAKTDVSSCLDCGWNNAEMAQINYKHRITNQERGDQSN